MSSDSRLKEVYYDQYCGSCKHKDLKEVDNPCYECLNECVNMDSHKPVYYEEAKKNSRKSMDAAARVVKEK